MSMPNLAKVDVSKMSTHCVEAHTSEDFVQMLVEFEPVREGAEQEQENCEPKEQQCTHDARCVPDLSGSRRD